MNVRKLITSAVAALGLAVGTVAVSVQPAMAATPYLGCFVDTPEYDYHTPEYCTTSYASYSYTVDFQIFDLASGSYAYRWNMNGWTPAWTWGGNCTTSSHCVVKNVRPPTYRTMSVLVTNTTTGWSTWLSADVALEPVCGSYIC